MLAWRESSRETHAAYDRLSSIAQLTAAMSEEATAQGDRARAYAALRVIAVMPDVSYARIERADGALLAETGAGVRLTRDVAGAAGGRASIAALVGSHTAEVSAPILYGGRTVGRVVMLGKLGDGGALLFSSLLLSLGAGLAAALAGLAVAGAHAAPHRRAGRGAHRGHAGGAREPRLRRRPPRSRPTTRSATWWPASTTCWPRSASATKPSPSTWPGWRGPSPSAPPT